MSKKEIISIITIKLVNINRRNTMKPNEHVKHPYRILEQCRNERSRLIIWNDAVLEWIANHILGSIIFFDMGHNYPLISYTCPRLY